VKASGAAERDKEVVGKAELDINRSH